MVHVISLNLLVKTGLKYKLLAVKGKREEREKLKKINKKNDFIA
jgi:hypothetical protein